MTISPYFYSAAQFIENQPDYVVENEIYDSCLVRWGNYQRLSYLSMSFRLSN